MYTYFYIISSSNGGVDGGAAGIFGCLTRAHRMLRPGAPAGRTPPQWP